MDKRRKLVAVTSPLLVGIIALAGAARSPRIQALHTVDYLILVAAGMCFGVALANALRARRALAAGRE